MSIKFQSVFKTWLLCKARGHNGRQLEEQDRKAEGRVERTFLSKGEGEGIEIDYMAQAQANRTLHCGSSILEENCVVIWKDWHYPKAKP